MNIQKLFFPYKCFPGGVDFCLDNSPESFPREVENVFAESPKISMKMWNFDKNILPTFFFLTHTMPC